jgi:uncharacterized protein (DUF488 family)
MIQEATSMNIFTMGYEGLDIAGFMSLLEDNGIDTVVDVRELPLSRKPGFSKKALENLVSLSGREYVHMSALGCPKVIRDRYREDGNWKRYTEAFLTYLKRQGEAIADLSSLVAVSNCILLCYEADYNFCHRSMVANDVKAYCGARVTHINAKTKKAHPVLLRQAFA